jgi:hypothetical protein
VRVVIAIVIVACVSTPPPQQPLGPPGTWTCKQIVDSCDNMCMSGMCLDACTRQGDPEAQRLHANLLGCAARNRCYDNNCTRALCGAEIQLCVGQGQPPPPDQPPPAPPMQPPLPTDRDKPPPALPPEPPHPPVADPHPHPPVADPHPQPPHPPVAHPAPAIADVTGEWSFGAKGAVGEIDPKTGARKPGAGAGGVLHLESDGRFERATAKEHSEGKCKVIDFTYAVGAWKLDGATLVLSEKQAAVSLRDSCHKAKNFDRADTAKDERLELRLTDKQQLEVTDGTGDVALYHK